MIARLQQSEEDGDVASAVQTRGEIGFAVLLESFFLGVFFQQNQSNLQFNSCTHNVFCAVERVYVSLRGHSL